MRSHNWTDLSVSIPLFNSLLRFLRFLYRFLFGCLWERRKKCILNVQRAIHKQYNLITNREEKNGEKTVLIKKKSQQKKWASLHSRCSKSKITHWFFFYSSFCFCGICLVCSFLFFLFCSFFCHFYPCNVCVCVLFGLALHTLIYPFSSHFLRVLFKSWILNTVSFLVFHLIRVPCSTQHVF